MRLTRRRLLETGGGIVAALALPPFSARAGEEAVIVMDGRSDGSHVWFDPIGIRVDPGQPIRWINRDPGNVHTATAYHPANSGRPQRIPEGVDAWNSDYLLPDEEFSLRLFVEGVYDYYCVPHEHAGMVGRIVVGAPKSGSWMDNAGADQGLPEVALKAFPPVEQILEEKIVRPGRR